MDYQTLVQVISGVVCGFGALWCLFAAAGVLPMVAIWRAAVEPVDDGTARESLRQVLSEGKLSGEWAEGVGLKPDGVYEIRTRYKQPILVGWRHASERTYLIALLMNGQPGTYNLLSVLQGGGVLATGTAAGSQVFPTTPDNAVQTFDVDDLAALWDRHREGLDYLASTRDRHVETTPGDLLQDFRAALRDQEVHLLAIPQWQLRFPYWYFKRPGSRHNKTLAQLGV